MKITRLYHITSDAYNDEFWETVALFTGELSKNVVETWLVDNGLLINSHHPDYDWEVRAGDMNDIMSRTSTLFGIEVLEEGKNNT